MILNIEIPEFGILAAMVLVRRAASALAASLR
jgi:hypothetical protein